MYHKAILKSIESLFVNYKVVVIETPFPVIEQGVREKRNGYFITNCKMINDNIDGDNQSQKLHKTTENMLNCSKDSSPCTETKGDTVQIPNPNINSTSSNNLPPPPPSLFLKFVKRVAICTAVVAIARYTYPLLLVIS